MTAIGFLRRAIHHYAGYGIKVERLMTDNGPAYRSIAHAAACRQPFADPLEALLDPVRDLDGVGARLLSHHESDRSLAADARDAPRFGGPVDDVRHVAQEVQVLMFHARACNVICFLWLKAQPYQPNTA